MEAVSAIGTFTAILVAVLLQKNGNKNNISDKILFIWLLDFALMFSIPYFIENKLILKNTTWGLIMGVLMISHFPILYIYTKSLTHQNFRINISVLLNLIPIFVYSIALIPYAFVSPEIQEAYANNKDGIPPEAVLPIFVFLFTLVFFLVKTLVVLRKHHITIRNLFSYEENVGLVWLKRLIIYFLVLFFVSLLAFLLFSSKQINVVSTDYSVYLALFVMFFGLSYKGYKHEDIFEKLSVDHLAKNFLIKTKFSSRIDSNDSKEQPKKSQDDINLTLLISYMEKEKPFLDQELNIGILANQLEIHSHKLSKLINIHFEQNFFEFINSYRVEEFKKLVTNPRNKHFSILGLAIDAGFNSKASFNRIFKKSTGQTPSEYRNQFKF